MTNKLTGKHLLTKDEYLLLKQMFLETFYLPYPEVPEMPILRKALGWDMVRHFCTYHDLFDKPCFAEVRGFGPPGLRSWLLSEDTLQLLWSEGEDYDHSRVWIAKFRNVDWLRAIDKQKTPEAKALLQSAMDAATAKPHVCHVR